MPLFARRKDVVYAVFVTAVFSRRIVRWALSDSMRTEALPLQASTKRLCAPRKQQVWCTILTTAHTMSALSTTSGFPSTGLVFASELLATHMAMLSLKTFTVPTKRAHFIPERKATLSRWKSPRLSRCHSGTTRGFIRAWEIEHRPRWKPSFGSRTRHRK